MAENLSFARQYTTYLGKTLGSYYLERLSEQVETGPIFLARSTNSQAKQLYCLRFLALPAGLTPEERLLYLGHFQREASRIAALEQVALLPLSDYGIFEGAPYLVSPDLASFSLQGVLTNNGPVDASLASHYLDVIATALEYAHQRGALHLNLNARNVFLDKDGQLLVDETGLMRMLTPQIPSATSLTADQSLALENGSPLLKDQRDRPLYGLSLASAPAPELLLGQTLNVSSDVYALGALLYYLLTGHRAMRGSTLAEIANQHLSATIPPLSTWRQDLPAELDHLLSSAMAKNPAKRLRHPGALANAYAGIIAPGQNGRQAFTVSSTPSALPAPISALATQRSALKRMQPDEPGKLSLPSRRRALTLIATGGGVAAVAGVVVWALGHKSSSSAPVASSNSVPSSQSTTTKPGSQRTASNPNPSGHSGEVVANAADVPVNSAKTFPIANSNNPGVLIHLQNSGFVAFNSTCTHAGCAVAYNQQNRLLECPCHSAIFDPARNAAVVSGPAPSPLTAIAITVNKDGTITTNG
jgi:eukaryotic-like serine/threonine-protein kinase